MIHFVLLQNRQGKSRLTKWYTKQASEEEDGVYDKRQKQRVRLRNAFSRALIRALARA